MSHAVFLLRGVSLLDGHQGLNGFARQTPARILYPVLQNQADGIAEAGFRLFNGFSLPICPETSGQMAQ